MKRCLFWFSFTIFGILSCGPVKAETQTFEQALASAYQTNAGLQAARAKLRATDEQVPQALSGWRPSIEATAEGGKSWQKITNDGFVPGTTITRPYDVGINLIQPVFRGFRTQATVRSAEAVVRAERAALQNTEQQLLLDSAKAYFDVFQSQSILNLNRHNEEILRKQLDATRARFKVGELKKTDVSQAESRLSAATVARIQAEGEVANNRVTFARLIGDMPGALHAPELVLESPRSIEDAVVLAEKNNPNLVALNYAQEVARADVASAEGNLMPEISLVGNVSWGSGWEQDPTLPERHDSAAIMARMTVPIYRSGADYSKIRAAKQVTTQRRLELEDARQKVREAAVSAWQTLMTAREAIMPSKATVEAAGMALYGVREEAKVGTRTILDVLNAEQELLNAKINLVRAEHDEAVAIFQVKAAVGMLTAEAMHLPVAIYNPTDHYETVRNKWIGLGVSDD